MANLDFKHIQFEVQSGKERLRDISKRIVDNEQALRERGISVKMIADKIRGRNEEVYHVNRTTLRISYENSSSPISIFGSEEDINKNKRIYEQLIGETLIPAGGYDYFKIKMTNDN